jgi:hypothetical protein
MAPSCGKPLGALLFCNLFLEEHLYGSSRHQDCKYLAESRAGKMLGPASSHPAPYQHSNNDKGSYFYVHVTGAVVLDEGEQSGWRQQDCEGRSLRGVLVHTEEVDQGGDNDDSAANADESGQDSSRHSNRSTTKQSFQVILRCFGDSTYAVADERPEIKTRE